VGEKITAPIQQAEPDAAGEMLPTPRQHFRGFGLRNLLYRYSLVLVWLLMAIIFTLLTPSTFISRATFVIIFGSQSVLLVLTLALLVPLLAGEFDLSVASTLGLATTLIAVLNGQDGWSVGLCVAIAITAGVLVGLMNGFLVVRIGVDAIVATLGMGTFLLGIALWVSNSTTTGGISQSLINAASTQFLGLPLSFYYGIAIAAIFWYVTRQTPLGRHLTFVGQGREVAQLAGIRVERLRWGTFVVSGLLSALAGTILAGELGAFQASTSPTFLLPAFAAAFLGSTVVDPGRFNAWGSVVAVYFLITGITGLELLGFSGWIEQVFYGGTLMIAVTLSTLVRRRVVG
jgi:ribose transport system permease protein